METDTEIRVSAESWPWKRNFQCRFICLNARKCQTPTSPSVQVRVWQLNFFLLSCVHPYPPPPPPPIQSLRLTEQTQSQCFSSNVVRLSSLFGSNLTENVGLPRFNLFTVCTNVCKSIKKSNHHNNESKTFPLPPLPTHTTQKNTVNKNNKNREKVTNYNSNTTETNTDSLQDITEGKCCFKRKTIFFLCNTDCRETFTTATIGTTPDPPVSQCSILVRISVSSF